MRVLFAVIVSVLVSGCHTGPCAKDARTTFAKESLQEYIDSGELPGAISVFYDNGIQETCCLGFADVEDKRPLTLESAYMQCSQTKGFCGVCIAQLVERGVISLDDCVSKYLPEFEDLWILAEDTNGVRRLVKAKNALTIRMCLNHTGGLPFELANFRAMGGWSRRMPLRSVAATAAAAPILFEPGTKARYSNVGIDIGAAVVEKVSGARWEDYLRENVLDPLAMNDTGFWPSDDQLADKIELYEVSCGRKAVWRPDHPSMQCPYNDDRVFPSAGAGLWTTAADQLKFYKMLMNLGVGENGVRILNDETVMSLLAVSTRPQGLGGYSLGLGAPEKDAEDAWFGHGGARGTQCMVNWHKRQLRMLVVQCVGDCSRYRDASSEAAGRFFKASADTSCVDAYTGRME